MLTPSETAFPTLSEKLFNRGVGIFNGMASEAEFPPFLYLIVGKDIVLKKKTH
jgi:hypothetical protein